MIGFGKIMVGVDWKEAGPEDRFGLSVNGYEAVSVGVAVAAAIDAEVTFVSILDCVDESSPDWNETAVDDRIRPDLDKRLIALAEYASQHGAAARACVCYGTAWLELVREVLRESYDLVILGARDATPDRPLGNLALKVLRNSPAPVWVTRPRPNPDDLFVLVPTDLSDDSLDTLYAAVYLGQITDSKTRVLHAVPAEAAAAESGQAGPGAASVSPSSESPTSGSDEPRAPTGAPSPSPLPMAGPADFPGMLGAPGLGAVGMPGGAVESQMDQTALSPAFREAEDAVYEQLACTDYRTLTYGVLVNVVPGPADQAILKAIEDYSIDLVVMGTGRGSDVPGQLGSTAETVLPWLPCGVFALKPRGFQSPVTLE